MMIMSKIGELRVKLRDRLIRFTTIDLVKASRVRHSNRTFGRKRPQSLALSPAQRQEILEYWKPYRKIDKELHWFAFYNAICTDKTQLKRYIPDHIFYGEIDLYFTSPRRCEALDDKNLYDLYFQDVRTPRTIIRVIDGQPLDDHYQPITMEQALQRCACARQVVCKEARLSSGGHGVRFFDFSQCTIEDLKQYLKGCSSVNIQEAISQHETLSRIHDKSINTLRIMSLMLDGTVHILSSVLRMGRDGARVDNASSGGIVCGINTDGTLKEFAYDTTGRRWPQHPQGTVFKGTRIEGYDKCCTLIKRLAGRFATATRLISWDFAVGEDGEPILIEVNLTYGEVDFHQMCNGPILGDLTEEILSRVYINHHK
jgi:hypothetical protein